MVGTECAPTHFYISMEDNLIKIPIGDKVIVLKYKDFDTDIDLDEVTRIDYSNLYGEIVTISSLLNRVGIMKADVENAYNDFKLELGIFESQRRKEIIRENLAIGNKKPSESTLDDEITIDPKVIAMRKRLNELQRDLNYIDAFYWAVQSKDKKLSVLMKGVTPEEFSEGIVEGIINTFYIHKFQQQL